MVHSVELLFDGDAEAAVRRDWTALAEAGLSSQGAIRAPSNRPHVTLAVAGRIDPAVDEVLRGVLGQLPIACRVGAPVLLGRRTPTLARLLLPSPALLALHAEIVRRTGLFAVPELLPHSRPGHWTPHVTVGRRVNPADVGAALAVLGPDFDGVLAGVRRWDGDARIAYSLSS